MASSTTPLLISISRHKAVLVAPAKQMPRELKPLSNIDDQDFFHMHVPYIQFYPAGSRQQSSNGRCRDPARIIKEALGKALVYYYPLAGRLREGPNQKLSVDCTGEGVLFVEADADVGLQEIGEACDGGFLRPPFPKELLMCDVPASLGTIHLRNECMVKGEALKPHLPDGYYGNTVVFPAAVCTAGDLTGNGPEYAVELIKKAKAEVTDEYVRSMTDHFMATYDRPQMAVSGSWQVADNTRTGFLDVDFGWGKPVYGGPFTSMIGAVPSFSGSLVKGVNEKGESGIFVLLSLPLLDMERFA